MKCGGIKYRADVQLTQTKRGILFSVRLNKLKKASCPGCKYCDYQDECLEELNAIDWPIANIGEAQHGRVYRLVVCNETSDHESGIITGWDYKIEEIKGG